MFRYDDKAVQTAIDKANRRLGPFVEDVLMQIGRSVLRKVQMNLSGRILHRRSGRLHNSWDFRIENVGSNKIRLIVGSIKYNVPYDEIHDKGGRTGRNHATTIPARYYYSRVPSERERAINRIIENKLKRLVA